MHRRISAHSPGQYQLALCLGKDRRFWKGLVRDAPAGIALAAGRHHITNFDADLASAAARGSCLRPVRSFREAQVARMIRNSIFQREILLPKRTSKPAANAVPLTGAERDSACRVALIGFGTVGRPAAR